MFFKIKNVNRSLARLTKTKKREETQLKSEMTGWNITTNLMEIKRIIRKYYEQLCTNK